MTYRLILASILTISTIAGQAQGVQFEDHLSWPQIQAKARKENKYILIDGFTTWCGPCRFMRTQIFTQPEAGSYFNDKFISVSVQLDSTNRDNGETRSWYADAHLLQREFNIYAFPTFIILSPDGKPLQRIIGSRNTAAQFIEAVEESFDTTKQYYTRLREYYDGRRDEKFLHQLALQANRLYDPANGKQIAAAYFKIQTDPYSHASLELLTKYTESTRDKGFDLFVDHPARIDSILGPGAAEQHVVQVLLRDYIEPAFRSPYEPSWKSIQRNIAAAYPAQAEEATLMGKVTYHEMKKDWHAFQKEINAYMEKYGTHITAQQRKRYQEILDGHARGSEK